MVDEIEVVDLGDAIEETKQAFYYPQYADSIYGLGWKQG